MSNKKQTAVEFAVEKLAKFIQSGNQLVIHIILEEAKELEKQQIMDARLTAPSELITYSKTTYLDEAEQYYNEIFNT